MSKAANIRRDINMDIIRCLALFFVLGIHFYTHCGIFTAGYTGLAAYFADVARNLFMTALSIFVMLNGYFQYKKTISSGYYLGILKLYEMYVLTSVLNLLYSRFYLGQEMGLREIFSALVNYGASEYAWYVLMYNGLFLLIPFLNLSYNNIAHRGHKRILIITFFLISATPFSFLNAFVNLNSYWWQRIWPLMFYFIGAYFGEYRPKVSAKKCGALFVVLLLVFSAYNFFVYEPSSPFFGHASASYRYTYESIQNAILTPVLFLWVMNIDMSAWPKKLGDLAAVVSTRVYGAFLFSSITDSFVYLWLCRFVPEVGKRFIFFPLTLPVSYVAAVFLAYLGDKVVLWADKLIRPLARAIVSWLYRITAPDAAAAEK
ncbi:MAG: acyltransferase family protein [Oscillospiraceae bacterium]|nr:acyltransferase family protein [Oscillospiraceae bacterium]